MSVNLTHCILGLLPEISAHITDIIQAASYKHLILVPDRRVQAAMRAHQMNLRGCEMISAHNIMHIFLTFF